jgi:hypothetical protein
MNPDDRVLVPITYGFSVRYLLPTGALDELSRVCRPVVGLGWDDPELESRITERGVEVVRLPHPEMDHGYRMFRRRLGVLHERRLDSPTSAIRSARALAGYPPQARAIATARRVRDRVAVRRPDAAATIERREPVEVERGTNVEAFRDLLGRHHVDAVLSLTPYHDQDALLLWAARSLGLRSVTAVISFDNPTTRDRLIVRSERVLVWNRFNRDELLRSYPDLQPSDVRIVGAPQFDLHRRPELRVPRDEWCARLGISADRPVLLYGAGPAGLVPSEERIVRLLDEAISERRVPDEPFLLVRRHPVDGRPLWGAVDAALRNGRVVDAWAPDADPLRRWPTQDELVMQMSSLLHSAVHVNVCSSMTLDGAVFDRPQIGPACGRAPPGPEARQIRALYRQEHWQPISRSGGLALATDEASLVAATAEALRSPGARTAGRRRMVRDVLTFDDGGATRRLVEQVAAS